jgi:catechol-2,3-dioxygenase
LAAYTLEDLSIYQHAERIVVRSRWPFDDVTLRRLKMLADRDAMATIAVKDLAAAKTFYQQKLGFSPIGTEEAGVVTLRSGNSTIVVYESQLAGTNKATSATWGVGNEIDSIVQSLKQMNVPFEHYDIPGLRREGDVHVAGKFKAAWFKDPDGNILHINNQ